MSVSPIEESLAKLNVLFNFSGMNLRKIETVLDTIKYRWLFAFNFLWVLSALIASVVYVKIGMSEGMGFVKLTSVAPCFTFTILSVIKSFFHLIHENHVLKLNSNLKELESTEQEMVEEKQNIIAKELTFLHAVLKVLHFLIISMIVVFDMTPLVLIAVTYLKSGKFEMLLPYLDVFLFIPSKIEYWVIAYIHQVWSEVVVLLKLGVADCLFFMYCTHIRIQFRLLQYDFENLIPHERGLQPASEQIKFNELVRRHQCLIESAAILEVIYSKSTLFNFLSSSIVICLTGFNVTEGDDPVLVITYVTFLCMGLMQVFLLCLFADMMRSASIQVGDAVYKCRWYLMDQSFGKHVLLVHIRSQDACMLTAAGFAEVNLRAFTRVLSTAWSYFALLQTLYKN